MRLLWSLAVFLATPALAQDQIPVPSGQSITFQEVIWSEPGPAGLTARFRFIAPQIARDGGTISSDTAFIDMDNLCAEFALPRVLTTTGPRPAEVIISLADRALPFGETAPEATQFFEAYAIENDRCEWVMF